MARMTDEQQEGWDEALIEFRSVVEQADESEYKPNVVARWAYIVVAADAELAALRAEVALLRPVAEAGQRYVKVSDSADLSDSGGETVALDNLAAALMVAGFGQEVKP